MTKPMNVEECRNQLLAAIAPEDFAVLEPDLELVALSRGQVLYEPGDIIHYAYSLTCHDLARKCPEGWQDRRGGSLRARGSDGPAECADHAGILWPLCRADVRLRLAHPGRSPRRGEERTAQASAVDCQLRQGPARTHVPTSACNAVHPVEARCCRWILILHLHLAQDTLPLTHEFLAEMLGVQRSTVSTVIKTLQTAGLIRQNRGSITVTDWTGLEATACECYGRILDIY